MMIKLSTGNSRVLKRGNKRILRDGTWRRELDMELCFLSIKTCFDKNVSKLMFYNAFNTFYKHVVK